VRHIPYFLLLKLSGSPTLQTKEVSESYAVLWCCENVAAPVVPAEAQGCTLSLGRCFLHKTLLMLMLVLL
jgi:hypothetical protein